MYLQSPVMIEDVVNDNVSKHAQTDIVCTIGDIALRGGDFDCLAEKGKLSSKIIDAALCFVAEDIGEPDVHVFQSFVWSMMESTRKVLTYSMIFH